MRYKKFEYPTLLKDEEGYYFQLYDGSLTKKFPSAKKFSYENGSYAICNKSGRVVEYMDLMGNFTKKPTQFAKDFRSYIETRNIGVAFVYAGCFDFYSHLIDFKSKYLIDEKVRKVVWNEEMSRFDDACYAADLPTLMAKIYYKKYVKQMFKQKLKKAKRLQEQMKKLDNQKSLNV